MFVRAEWPGRLVRASPEEIPPPLGKIPPSAKEPEGSCLDSLRGSPVKVGTTQRRLAWPLRKYPMPDGSGPQAYLAVALKSVRAM